MSSPSFPHNMWRTNLFEKNVEKISKKVLTKEGVCGRIVERSRGEDAMRSLKIEQQRINTR